MYRVVLTKGTRTTEGGASPPVPVPQLMSEADVELRREGSRLVLDAKRLMVAQLKDGVRQPWTDVLNGQLADVHLDLRDRQLVETDGATTLWSASTNGTNLSLIWPALPSEARVGAAATWTLSMASSGVIVRTEARRGPTQRPLTAELEAQAPPVEPALVVPMGPVRVTARRPGRVPVVVLEGTWQHPIDHEARLTTGPRTSIVTTKGKAQYTAVYEVAQDGRLLSADVTRRAELALSFDDGEPRRARNTDRIRATLIASCDGLRGPPPAATDTPASEALETWQQVARAANAKQSVLNWFHPTIVARHGPKLDATLGSYLKRHGPQALGMSPLFVEGAPEVDGQTLTFRTMGIAKQPAPPGQDLGHLSVSIEVSLDTSLDPPPVTRLVVKDGDRVLLQVDADTIR